MLRTTILSAAFSVCVLLSPATYGSDVIFGIRLQSISGTRLAGTKLNFKSADSTVSGTTDEDGHTSVVLDSDTNYTISVESGWDLEVVSFEHFLGMPLKVTPGANPSVRAPAPPIFIVPYDVVIRVTRGPVSGRVTSRGRGIQGVTVRALNMSNQALPGATATTDKDGNWKISDIRQRVRLRPDAVLKVGGRDLNYRFRQSGSSDPGVDGNDFIIDSGPIAGQVVDKSGRGISDTEVRLAANGARQLPAPVRTNREGFFAFDNLDVSQTYTVSASRPGFSFGAPLERRWVGETDLRIYYRTGTISVKAHHPDNRLVSVDVYPQKLDTDRANADTSADVAVWSGDVTTGTSYRIPANLEPGTYLVKAESRDALTGRTLIYEPVSVTVGDSVVGLYPPMFIRGTVGSKGSPLSGVTVTASPSGAGGAPLSVKTNANGNYILLGVKPNTQYTLAAELDDDSNGVRLTSHFPRSLTTTFTTETSGLSHMNFAATRSIQGRVTASGAEGSSLSGITLKAEVNPSAKDPDDRYEVTTTDEEGRYEFDGFAFNDRSLIRIEPSFTGMRFEPDHIEARPGASNVHFTAEGGVAGRIVYKDGSPAADIEIDVTSRDDFQFAQARTVVTDEDGRFFATGTKSTVLYTLRPRGNALKFRPESTTVRGMSVSSFEIRASPPEISVVASQFAGLESRVENIAFTVSDRETGAENLKVYARSSDEDIIADSSLELTQDGSACSLSFATGKRAGEVDIELTVRDGDYNEVVSTFRVSVGFSPTFHIVELNTPEGLRFPKIIDMNDMGDILVSAFDAQGNPAYGLVASRQGGSGGVWYDIPSSWKPVAINNHGLIALGAPNEFGIYDFQKPMRLVAWGPHVRKHWNNVPRVISTSYNQEVYEQIVGSLSREEIQKAKVTAVDINDRGDVGLSVDIEQIGLVNKKEKLFNRNLMVAVNKNPDQLSEPDTYGIDYRMQWFGYSKPIGRVTELGSFQPASMSPPELIAISNSDVAIVSFQGRNQFMLQHSEYGKQMKYHPFKEKDIPHAIAPNGRNFAASREVRGGYLSLGGHSKEQERRLPYINNVHDNNPIHAPRVRNHHEWLAATPHSINDRDEVVGLMTRASDFAIRVFYFRPGQTELFDLNDLVEYGTRWRLEDKVNAGSGNTRINREGEIAGIGVNPEGQVRAFLAVPVIEAGTRVPRPPGTVAEQPNVPNSVRSAFVWSFAEKSLYAVKPVDTVVDWKTSTDPTNPGKPVRTRVVAGWPKMPQMHVVGAPVELHPRDGETFPYAFRRIAYQEGTSASVDLTKRSPMFNNIRPGYSVLEYAETDGSSTDPAKQKLLFQVVRSLPADAPDFAALTELGEREGRRGPLPDDISVPVTRTATIGTRIQPPTKISKAQMRFVGTSIEFYAIEPGQEFDGQTIVLEPRTADAQELSQNRETGVVANYDGSSRQMTVYVNTAGVKVDDIINAVNKPATGVAPFQARRRHPGGPNLTIQLAVGKGVDERVAVLSGGWIGHDDYRDRTGFVVNLDAAPVDATGEDAAYRRENHSGTILPVNEGDEGYVDVAWYRRNGIGVAWPDRPMRYRLSWPEDAPAIVIADQQRDTASLPPEQYPNARIYQQADPERAGFNPNEEHAFIEPGRRQVVALRSDINAISNTSKPFVLVKYWNNTSSEWMMKAFRVVPEDDTHRLHYLAQAGIELQPPYPLNVLAPLCSETRAVYGPVWQDVRGKHYGYAAGPGGTDAVASIRYYYRLQQDFYVPPEWRVKTGECVAWLSHYTALTAAPTGVPERTSGTDPVDCLYTVTWPHDLPAMKLNDTLSTPRDGLPAISTQQRSEILYESMNPAGRPDLGVRRSFQDSVVRIYNATEDRVVTLTRLPDYLETELRGSEKIFPGLPFQLQVRLFADDSNPSAPVQLIFRGQDFTQDLKGGGLLLPNIMTAAERDLLKKLDREDSEPPDPAWAAAIDSLYALTRNPNRLLENEVDPQQGRDRVSEELLTGMNRGWIVRATDGTEFVTRERPDSTSSRPRVVVIPESFPAGHNVLTTALTPKESGLQQLKATVRPFHVSLDGTDDFIEIGAGVLPAFGEFAVELRTKPAAFGPKSRVLLCTTSATDQRPLLVTVDPQGVISINNSVTEARLQADVWQHVALVCDRDGMRVLIDGAPAGAVAERPASPNRADSLSVGGPPTSTQLAWAGAVGELRVWQGTRSDDDIKSSTQRRMTGREAGLVGYWQCSEGIGSVTFDRTGRGRNATFRNGVRHEQGEPVERPNGYVTLAFNNDTALKGSPVSLEIIRIVPQLEAGDIRVLPSDNVFDERLTLRHNSDFGGATADYEFEWYYHRGSDNPEDQDGRLVLPRIAEKPLNPGWLGYGETTTGANQITLGQGGESGVLVISDNRWMMRYRPRSGTPLSRYLDGQWSEWVGAPGLDPPEAQLAEGWIKRVTRALNPFDARTDDFRSAKVETYANLLMAAGRRYEGPIAFNGNPDAINSIGLIEAYETVLRRGRQLSIDGAPPVRDDSAANQALLHATSKISDLYVMLGNEAFADAQDPTIGYSTSDGNVGTRASGMFAFQNQLSSLLEEELCLLRGIDGSSGSPAYNRLRWNMTGDRGQLAYVNVYNIYNVNDNDRTGKINVADARTLYPQGHGDAWGHYLTAVSSFYRLLRHPNFRWEPRKESVLLAGAPVDVDYMDERKFAQAAAARAQAGTEIVNLTYRRKYESKPERQFDGYTDTDSERAWGVTEWARRTGQGTYFDWIVGNAILPDVDPDATHEGIEKIDRTTVHELTELVSTFSAVQTIEDNANDGLNPLGLVDSAIAFDIDPFEVDAGKTQYEQIAERAETALKNAVTVFDYANAMSRNLRRTQDSAAEYAANVAEQETDFTNRLIEIFGYPHRGKIGSGQPYGQGYNGPDLLFYNYVDPSDLTGQRVPSVEQVRAYFNTASDQISSLDDISAELSSETAPASNATLTVTMPVSDQGWPFVTAGDSWGQRRAPGEVQLAIADLLQAENSYRRSLQVYHNHLTDIDNAVDDLRSKYDLDAANLSVLNWKRDSTIAMNTTIGALHTTEVALNRTAEVIDEVFETVEKAIPRVVGFSNDVTAPVRATIRANGIAATQALAIGADVAEVAGSLVELGKEQLEQDAEIKIFRNDSDADLSDMTGELEQLIRQEVPMRMALYNQRDQIQQANARYLMALQKGLRLLEQRESFRRRTAGAVSQNRYRDMTFRVFRNSAIQKFRVQFELAARYVYLAARAYDYETTLMSDNRRAATQFYDDIVSQRSLGEWADGPVAQSNGLASSLAMLNQNFSVLKGRLGLNNRDNESGVFSLKSELFRIRETDADEVDLNNLDLNQVTGDADARQQAGGLTWKQVLENHRVANLWDLPVFRRHCRPFARESSGPQPGIVIPFSTTIESGRNLFGWPLSGNEFSFDASQFATKIRSVGVVFEGYPNTLSRTPRVYLVPIGTDIMRSALGRTMEKREFKVTDQAIPVPFPIGRSELQQRDWSPMLSGDGDSFADVRRFSRFRAYGVPGTYGDELDDRHQQTSSRLISRSVWNTRWVLIIPGQPLHRRASDGISQFIDKVDDINLTLETYSYSGN